MKSKGTKFKPAGEVGLAYDLSEEEDAYNKEVDPDSPDTIYEKPLAPRKIADKTGWKVREENKEIFGKKD